MAALVDVVWHRNLEINGPCRHIRYWQKVTVRHFLAKTITLSIKCFSFWLVFLSKKNNLNWNLKSCVGSSPLPRNHYSQHTLMFCLWERKLWLGHHSFLSWDGVSVCRCDFISSCHTGKVDQISRGLTPAWTRGQIVSVGAGMESNVRYKGRGCVHSDWRCEETESGKTLTPRRWSDKS